MRWGAGVALVATAALVVPMAACSGGDGGGNGGAESTERSTTSTTVAMAYTAATTADRQVDAGWRQGLARTASGWVFSTNNGLWVTGDDFVQVGGHVDVIPPPLVTESYDHVGDIDIAAGVLWAPLERPDRQHGQVIARYDAETLEFLGSDAVAQHHAAWVAVDGDVVYSMDAFDRVGTVARYRWDGEHLDPVEPLTMSRELSRVQGGDVADGALWLSTDDEQNGVFRVDLASGEVTGLGSAGRAAGEGEGIDATDLPAGQLHVLVADPAVVPMWVSSFTVTATPA
jgi:hypothetical protein